ncbi:MAG: TIGR01906 family membrane protein [Dehalococcoidia bacterium]|nr:TIGR01906 family membrane protein [Dehalococcoidia bacterium]
MKSMRSIAAILFILAVPVLLISANLWLAATDMRLYEYGFDKHNVTARTGLDRAELLAVGQEIVDYFRSDAELLDSELFGPREIAHMKDVKGLVQLSRTVMLGAAAYLAAFAVAYLAWKRRTAWHYISRNLVLGSAATIAILAVLGLWALIGFENLFLLFHLISFRNDLWQLSPGDALLRLFPEGFFSDATLFVAGATVVEAAIIGTLAWFFSPMRRARSLLKEVEAGSPGQSPGSD